VFADRFALVMTSDVAAYELLTCEPIPDRLIYFIIPSVPTYFILDTGIVVDVERPD